MTIIEVITSEEMLKRVSVYTPEAASNILCHYAKVMEQLEANRQLVKEEYDRHIAAVNELDSKRKSIQYDCDHPVKSKAKDDQDETRCFVCGKEL